MAIQKILSFLKDLSLNNNREWFDENRDRYRECKLLFEQLTELIIMETAKIDPSVQGLEPKDCIFRIFRDTRFSKDKTPYKDNFGAYIVKGGKKSQNAGYYFHLSPDESFVAGGCHMPVGDVLKGIRISILEDPEHYAGVISDPKFVDTFGEIRGDSVKTVPRGFDKKAKGIELIRKKQYFVMRSLSKEEVVSEQLVPIILDSFKTMKPLNDFMNDAIG